MALTQSQKDAIKRQMSKNIAKRAAMQRTKISDAEARKVSATLNKRPGVKPSFVLKDTNLLSKSELKTLGSTAKANAVKEKSMQKQRNFAKGTGKLPIKDRVGTKSEYKQLGRDIQTRKDLIARGKAARAAQAARAANPEPLTKATPAKVETPMATKKTTVAKKAAVLKKGKTAKPTMAKKTVTAITKPVEKTSTPKASTAAIKKRITPNAKSMASKGLQTLDEARAAAPRPKGKLVDQPARKPGSVQTLSKPETKLTKAPNKLSAKVAEAKNMAKSSTAGRTVKAAKVAAKPIADAAAKTKTVKVLKGAGKVGGKLFKLGAVVNVGKEVLQVGSGQAEKDFRRIQALENRIAAAKGQKPKYTKSGSNRNPIENAKVGFSNIANAVTMGAVGQSRKGRLAELKGLAAKAEGKKNLSKGSTPPKTPTVTTPAGNKVGGNTPTKAPMGDKYIVQKGDTLSAIASRSGVSLKELRAANPKFATQAKYKGGNTIFSGTSVSIPKKKAK